MSKHIDTTITRFREKFGVSASYGYKLNGEFSQVEEFIRKEMESQEKELLQAFEDPESDCNCGLYDTLNAWSLQQRKEAIQEAIARLAVEIMEVELHKNKDDYTSGHIHGLRRVVVLLGELLTLKKEQPTPTETKERNQ